MFDKHDVAAKKFDAIVEKVGLTLLGVAGQITLGILDLDLPCDIRDIIADVKNLAETDRVRWNLIGMLAFDLIGLIPVIGVLKYSDETAESVASGEKY